MPNMIGVTSIWFEFKPGELQWTVIRQHFSICVSNDPVGKLIAQRRPV